MPRPHPPPSPSAAGGSRPRPDAAGGPSCCSAAAAGPQPSASNGIMRRIVSLWLPRLPTDRLERRRPGASAEPRATIQAEAGRMVLAAVNRAAQAAGLRPGLGLAEARGLVPELDTAPADPAGDRALLEALIGWCGRYTPWVGGEGGDGAWLDITGGEHLFGGEAGLLADLGRRLADLGFTAVLGAADAPGAAWALARQAARPGRPAIAAPGQTARAVGALSVRGLRLPAGMAGDLERLGLHRIADLAALPRAALGRRFGAAVGRRLDQALGRAEEPIMPRPAETAWRVRAAFADPIAAPEAIALHSGRLIEALCAELEKAGRGLRRARLVLYRVDGSTAEAALATARPTRRAADLARLLAERL
ncbi:MAG: DNA polymerase Y family protein, partial [Alphaproteobacteria bacterium]|nr:DNA polymerase Y family protein [Alphaproteobacteria bacterium]